MKIPIVYNLRSMRARPVSTLMTAVGIALVVAVFIGMLALANGFASALVRTGSESTVLVLRKGADSEMSSRLDRAAASRAAMAFGSIANSRATAIAASAFRRCARPGIASSRSIDRSGVCTRAPTPSKPRRRARVWWS